MTLDRLFPTLHAVLHARVEPGVWPGSTAVTGAGEMLVGGVALSAVAARWGTPVRVLDRAEVQARCAAYRTALPTAETAFAVAALPLPAVLRWITAEGLSLAVRTPAELAAARTAGCPAGRIIAHGPPSRAGREVGARTVVVRSFAEIDRLAAGRPAVRRDVLIRVAAGAAAPGIGAPSFGDPGPGDPGPGTPGFGTSDPGGPGLGDPGFRIEDGSALAAAARVLAVPGARLAGAHCHLGAQTGRIARYEVAARRLLALLAAIRDQLGVVPDRLNLGGGHTIAYTPGAPALDLHGLAARLTAVLHYESRALALPLPALTLEPGRAIAGPAGVTLHRVLRVTPAAVTLDGPLDPDRRAGGPDEDVADGHHVRVVGRISGPRRPFAVTGAVRAVPLPEDVTAGDLLAVARTGAHPAGSDTAVVAVAGGVARALAGR